MALIVVGLEAPAFAAPPTVASFAPVAGAGGCVVQITGTNFNNPAVFDVEFDNVNANGFAIISGTEIWARAPAAVTSGPISVNNGDGPEVSSSTSWTANNPSGCSPTAASFAPTCGPAGTDVTITGTRLMRTATLGADVFFAPFGATPGSGVAATATAAAPTLTSVAVNVPAGAADGPLGVVTFANVVGQGAAFSPTAFDFGTCITKVDPSSGDVGAQVIITGVGFQGFTSVTFTGAGSTKVQAIATLTTDTEATDTITATVPVGAITGPLQVNTPGGNPTSEFTIGQGPQPFRNVTLKLSGKLNMKGKVKSDNTDCVSAVSVKLQRKKKGGGWKNLKTVTTSDTGAYSGHVKNKTAKYRSLAPATTAPATCDKAVSPVKKHKK